MKGARNRMRISICGDVCPAKTNEIWRAGKKEELFHDIPETFEGSERVIVNLECALTDTDYVIAKKGPNVKASPLCAKVLKEIGVTDCAISNNHIYDYGEQGVLDTMQAIADYDMGITGFGKNTKDARQDMVIQKDGVSVAVLAVCEHEYSYALPQRMGAREFDVFDTLEDIRNAKQEHDYVVVLYHGGKEQSVYPSPRLRKQSQAMIKNGADVVLCQHSHCVGCYEEYEGGHILYGQGNFHFTDFFPEHPQWQNGLIVHLEIESGLKVEFTPVIVEGKGIRLAKKEEADAIMNMLERQSDDLKTNAWIQGWNTYCQSVREVYLRVIRNAYTENATPSDNELFDHFLRCEAHRDVWMQLCRLSWETREKP